VSEKEQRNLANLKTWVNILRIPFHTALILPLFLGMIIAWSEGHEISWAVLVIATVGVFLASSECFLANEYFDYETDCVNRSYNRYTGGSRVLPQGQIPRNQVLAAAIVSGCLALGLAMILQFYFQTASLTIPTLINLAVLDQTAAIAISHGIITALFFRERHGVGQEVHSSLFSAALWFQYTNMMMNGCISIDQIPSERSQNSPLRNSFRCKDGNWIVGTHHGEKHWALFCEATGQTELLKDSHFSSEASRKVNCKELIELFDRVFVTKTRDEWMEVFRAHGLMFCPVQEIHEVFTDLQALKNDYVVDFDHPALGKVNILGYPIHFSSAQAGTLNFAPALGEHTKSVMKQLGFSDEEIKEFKNEGVIAL
jgi:hypothetical protein